MNDYEYEKNFGDGIGLFSKPPRSKNNLKHQLSNANKTPYLGKIGKLGAGKYNNCQLTIGNYPSPKKPYLLRAVEQAQNRKPEPFSGGY